MAEFLDIKIIEDLRKTVNSTNLFSHDERYKCTDYNLISAVMDRVDTCVKYLNDHSSTPATEENFIVFLMFSSMLVDAVKETFKQLNIDYPYHESKQTNVSIESTPQYYEFFKKSCLNSELNIVKEKCPTDDKFFEYFRSLSFAHPVETSRARFLQDGEIQYSPWVIINKPMLAFNRAPDFVGIRIYSNKFEDILDFTLSFSILKGYIASRHALLAIIIEKITIRINEQKNEWKKHRVNRVLPHIDVLYDIESILKERHEDLTVEDLIKYLECQISDNINLPSVKKFRKAITDNIPKLCDAIDNMDYEEGDNIISIAYRKPKITHKMFHYQMEKIFTYLEEEIEDSTKREELLHEADGSNLEWGLIQANNFAKEFAKKWVTIDTNIMSLDEIKLLVRTACFLEWQEQGGK